MKKSHDLTGKKFGKGIVIRESQKPPHLVRGGLYWEVLCECGETRIVDTTSLKKKWTNCGCVVEENIVGRRFHNGVVVSSDGSSKNKKSWSLVCDCGNSYSALTESLKSGNTKSCGCLNFRNGKDHPHYKGHEDLSGDYWGKLKKSAKKRNIKFCLTITSAWELFVNQKKKCALTGWDITLTSHSRSKQTASLDRIDSENGYVSGNVQWVHKDVNRMKQNFSQKYLFELCEAISQRRND